MSEEKSQANPKKASNFGCFLMMILWAFLFLSVAYTCYKGWSMDRELNKFTQGKPTEVIIAEPLESDKRQLDAKLRTFKKQYSTGTETELNFTIKELNNMIATYPAGTNLRGYFWARKIELATNTIKADVMIRFNGFPIIGKPKYLNAVAWFKFNQNTNPAHPKVKLEIAKLEPKFNKKIPNTFLESIKNYLTYQFIFNDPKLKPYLQNLKNATIKDNHIKLIFLQSHQK